MLKNEFAAAPRRRHLGRARRCRIRAAIAISIRDNRFTKERIGILAANVSVALERNEIPRRA